VLYLCAVLAASAQLTERPGNSLDDPVLVPRDLTGLSIKTPRVRVVHTSDPALEGGSMYLQEADPWLGYKWGHDLFQREFRERDGVFGNTGALYGLTLADGATKMMDHAHVNSCAVCHNTPYRDGGAGAVIPKNGGEGRKAPHLFGAGLVEMLGWQIRQEALAIADTNRDGWISLAEAKDKRCVIKNLPDGVTGEATAIDFGSFEDLDGSGRPNLNAAFSIIYVDQNGQRIPFATNLHFPGVAGYTLEFQSFGFGQLSAQFQPPIATTLRAFIATAWDTHCGLQAFDPVTSDNPDNLGFTGLSNAGQRQCITAALKDRGVKRGPTGISLDDPDGDGYCEEISAGDLDMAEWFLLNHPAPAQTKVTAEVQQGGKLFKQMQCATCHVADWQIQAASPGTADYTQRFAGDRRFFDLQVAWNDATQRLEGKLVSLSTVKDGLTKPKQGAYTVRGLYSDFKYHDAGSDFYQTQYDGSVVKLWRTRPLWGVGTTAPYGHDGASLTLDDVIRRHGNEAQSSHDAYVRATDAERAAVLAFLNSLVLYQTDRLPCDVNGDGKISEHFMVAGMDTGPERFNPEWLFKVPGKIEGPVAMLKGEKIVSFALVNVRQAYGLDLKYLKDSDNDGFPDVIDPEPFVTGYHDGVK